MLKQRRFFPILLIAACMLAVVLLAAWSQSGALLPQVRFQDSVHGQTLRLFYDQEQDCHVLFLPPFTDAQDIECSGTGGVRVTCDLDDALTEPAVLTVKRGLRQQQYLIRLMQTSSLPSTFIHAEEGLIDYLNEDKKNTRDVVVTMLDAQGDTMLQSTASMYGRGNGSWDSPSKKPYNLEFSKEISVGPFTDVTKLCLLAEHSDESKLRNSLAYYAGKELGVDYASAYQYTNLYVNGEYLGLYGIVTKQEYKKHLDSDNIQAVFEIATAQNRVEFDSALGWRINVIHGSKQQVQDLISGFEEALAAKDWEKTRTYIDPGSIAQKYALEEFLANLDLAYGSQYFYVDEGGKIHAMLPWDYDWTLGSSYMYFNNRQANELKVYRNPNSWYFLLMEQFPFRELAVEVWQNQFDDGFLKKLEDHLQQDIAVIGDSWACDQLRWKYEPPYNPYDLASGVETLNGFYDLFREFFYQRREFLLGYYTHWWDYRYIGFFDARWGNLFLPKEEDPWAYLEGASILEVNDPGERFLGWYYGDVPLEEITDMPDCVSIQGRVEPIEKDVTAEPFWWLELAVICTFAVLMAALLIVSYRRMRLRRFCKHACAPAAYDAFDQR